MNTPSSTLPASSLGLAVVTGASSGIGAVYADRLVRRGYDLLLVARNQERLDAVASRLRTDTGRQVEVLAADLGRLEGQQLVETRLAGDARITLLVNNAGIGATSPLATSDVDALDAMVQLNVVALTRLTRAVVPGFVSRGQGTVINIASIVAVAPELLNGVYGGSKAFVLAFTQSLHHELAAQGVRVQAVLPGATRTDFWQLSGLPVEHLPQEIVMGAEDMVDAALKGLDLRELVTIPALPDAADWDRFEAARRALGPGLSHQVPAARYSAA